MFMLIHSVQLRLCFLSYCVPSKNLLRGMSVRQPGMKDNRPIEKHTISNQPKHEVNDIQLIEDQSN
jgi:hypothetical protein